MNQVMKKNPSGNIKWLLVILALLLGALVAYAVPGYLGDNQPAETPADNGSPPIDLSDLQERVDQAVAVLDRNPADLTALKAAAGAWLEMGMRQSDSGGVDNISDSYRSYKAAVDYYRRYLALQPGDVEVRIDLGLAYFYLVMYDVAERELAAAAAAAPLNQRAWLSLGWVQDTAGKSEEARASWQKAVAIDPQSEAGQEAQRFIDSAQARAGYDTSTTP